MTTQRYRPRPPLHTFLLLAGILLGFRGCFIDRMGHSLSPEREMMWEIDVINAKLSQTEQEIIKGLLGLKSLDELFSAVLDKQMSLEESLEAISFFGREGHGSDILPFLENTSPHDERKLRKAIAALPLGIPEEVIKNYWELLKELITDNESIKKVLVEMVIEKEGRSAVKGLKGIEKYLVEDDTDEEYSETSCPPGSDSIDLSAYKEVEKLCDWLKLFSDLNVEEHTKLHILNSLRILEREEKKKSSSKRLAPYQLLSLLDTGGTSVKQKNTVKELLLRIESKFKKVKASALLLADFLKLQDNTKTRAIIKRLLQQGAKPQTDEKIIITGVVGVLPALRLWKLES
ncbi:MAG: hypothetical protein AAFP93_00380 [Bacteroidota bacterium]